MIGKTNVGGGGSGSAWAYIAVTYPSGSTCSATNGSVTLSAQGTSGLYVFQIPQPTTTPETWTVSCTDGTRTKSTTVSISAQYQSANVTLSYSRLPEGYIEVAYLEQQTGVEYVQFPNMPNNFTGSVEFAWQPTSYSTSNTYSIMGSIYYNPTNGCSAITSNSNQVYRWVNSVYQSQVADNSVRRVVINQPSTRNTIENNVVLGTCSGTVTGGRLYYGAAYYSGIYYSTSPMRLFEFKQTDNNGDLILDAVPCRTTANLVGFYDMITGTFYQNGNSSGSFIAGADV